MELLYTDFDMLQGEIEELSDDPDLRYQERETFETQYYDAIGVAKALCDTSSAASPNASGAEVSSLDVNTQRHNNFVRLPKIELPTFNGSYQHWLEFRDTFISIIHSNDSIDYINKFHYLRACLQGSAALIIKSLDFKANNYASAWELVCKRYDNKRLLVNNHVQSLFNVNAVQRESSKSLRYIVDATNKNLRALATLDQPTEHWDTLIIYMMASKLDSVTNREWEEYRNQRSEPPTLEIFLTFLTNRADLLETLEEAKGNKNKFDLVTVQKPKSFIVSTGKPKNHSCPLCHKDHQLFSCDSFRKLPVETRIQKIKEFKVCQNCLRPGHHESRCKLTHCKYCSVKHNTLLHLDPPQVSAAHDSIVLSAEHSRMSSNITNILLSTALVKVIDEHGRPHSARILLDNGSTGNFVTQDFCSRLNLQTHLANSRVTGINNQSSNSSQSCSLTLESYNGSYRTDIECFVLPHITSLLPNTLIDTHDLHIPSGICLADPAFNVPSNINILVGADVFWAVIGTNRIQLGKNKPVLFETKFRWLVSGAMSQTGPKNNVCLFANDTQTNSELSRFWELDTIPSQHELTSEERLCEQSFSNSTRRDKDGRFVVSMPLKESPDVLGESFSIAKRRFLSLERRLERAPHMKQLYIEFMREYLELGHMTETLSVQPDVKRSYLPHHGVYRETSSTTKLRVVFDASASTSSGKSLNDIQRVGPTIQDDIIAILLRFRQHQYVVTADVEKMYRQINIVESQRPLQSILWRFDPSHPLKTYTLNTVTYGTASVPYLATRCLLQIGYESSNPIVKRAICHDFYVDDFLSGNDSIDATIQLCRDVKCSLETAKFRLRKWHSNCDQILDAICCKNEISGSVNLSAKETAKTLGLNWICSSDILKFLINVELPDSNKVTKRQILSTISQVFDPLGLISPCILEAKLLVQQLWIQKCTWDEIVPSNIKKMWQEFSTSLSYLNNLEIPRCIKIKLAINTQIHTFVDASEKAYGACVYIRSVASDGTLNVSLLASKSKVAPTKTTTIPRLELCAALLGTRLFAKIVASVTFEYSSCTFWTDSMIVLGWLSSSPKQLKAFVRHRVIEIQDTSTEWRYVPSKQNPADLVSRGLRANLIEDSTIWWSGPSYLKLESCEWPDKPYQNTNLKLPELVQSFHSLDIPQESILSKLIKDSSNLIKLTRTVAFLLRFINNCRKNTSRLYGHLSISELNTATTRLLLVSQQESFSVERQLLINNGNLPRKNRLLSLSPFMDSDKLIRVGGRLSDSHYDYNVKHPILLCSKHRLSQLIFESLHKTYLHSGPQLLLATVRHNYWPLGGTRLAKRIVRSCIICCRFKGKTLQPVMGNLPSNRVHLEYPFLETGVDYAGPVLIADRKGRGCKLIKSYICVFVCLATKALHLELVSDLTKEAFIAALNRFIARRGKPQNVFSDNGTTFVGTFNELSKLLREPSLSSSLVDRGIHFSFIPAYTPHFGGLWESAVKSVKHHLRRVLKLTHLDFEEMATLLIQVEAVLNSRPITPISDDPSDLSCLTPAHFLIGRSIVSLPHPQLVNRRINSLQRFQRIEALKQHFWSRFNNEYVLWLQRKTKWHTSQGELKEGTLVLVKDKTSPPLMWLLGRVVRVLPGRDGVARVADIKTRKGVIRRAYNTICPLPTSFEDETSRRRVYGDNVQRVNATATEG